MQKFGTDIERRVDELIVSQLNQNEKFARLFVNEIGRQVGFIFNFTQLMAERSPRRLVRGQTDIGVTLAGVRPSIFLIENKVMSPFTDGQADRYKEECQMRSKSGHYDRVEMILIAPEYYAQRASIARQFDVFVSYETLDNWLGGNALLQSAIDRCRDGWIAEEVMAVSVNFSIYSNIVRSEFPNLRVKTKPENKPTQSRTIYFDEKLSGISGKDLPNIILNHQWQEGRAKLLFRTWGDKRENLEPMMSRDIKGSGLEVDPNRTKSLGVMLNTPVIDNHQTPYQQIEHFRAGLRCVDQLRVWFHDHQEIVKRWGALASNDGTG